MKQQGPHKQRISRAHAAKVFRLPRLPILDLLVGKNSIAVRPGQHTQRPIRIIRGVQMQSHNEHLFKKCDGRLHVGNARFNAPWTKTGEICARLHGHVNILVPRYQPIRAKAFIKVNRANRERFGIETGTDQIEHGSRPRQRRDFWHGQNPPSSGAGHRTQAVD